MQKKINFLHWNVQQKCKVMIGQVSTNFWPYIVFDHQCLQGKLTAKSTKDVKDIKRGSQL